MPELPEVEIICRALQHNIIGKKISQISISDKKLRLPFPSNLESQLSQQKILSISRRARYILINLSNNKILIIHLGMSGKLIYERQIRYKTKFHDHFMMKFSDRTCLIYNDPRRFGLIDLVENNQIQNHKMIKKLAVEPLSKQFNAKYLQRKLSGKKINIKTVMMDNALVVGVGNIYINESLFISGISPLRMAGNLQEKELQLLVKNIKKILRRAIKCGGSTLKDYLDLNGKSGEFQFDFKIYGRDNQSCFICSNLIRKIRQNGRSSFYCPNCQN